MRYKKKCMVLERTYYSEEEGGLIRLQRGLWIQRLISKIDFALSRYHRCSAKLLDELQQVNSHR